MSTEFKPVSIEVDDFTASAIYAGGTGNIVDMGFKLYDYNGQVAPNSVCVLYMNHQPTDGSNDNKVHEQIWSMGPASEFQPDATGATCLSKGRAFSQSSNGYIFFKSLRDNCGLEKGKLSGPTGVKVLVGSAITLVQVDTPVRENLDNRAGGVTASGGPAKPQAPKKMLIASKAKWGWESGAGKPAAAAPVAGAPAATATTPTAASGAGGDVLVTAIAAVLAANDNAVMLTDLKKLVTENLATGGVQLAAAKRIALLKRVDDQAKLIEMATANGWTVDTTDGVLMIA